MIRAPDRYPNGIYPDGRWAAAKPDAMHLDVDQVLSVREEVREERDSLITLDVQITTVEDTKALWSMLRGEEIVNFRGRALKVVSYGYAPRRFIGSQAPVVLDCTGIANPLGGWLPSKFTVGTTPALKKVTRR